MHESAGRAGSPEKRAGASPKHEASHVTSMWEGRILAVNHPLKIWESVTGLAIPRTTWPDKPTGGRSRDARGPAGRQMRRQYSIDDPSGRAPEAGAGARPTRPVFSSGLFSRGYHIAASKLYKR